MKATPSVHEDNEVTLQLEFEIRALAGNSVNGIPIITNRTVTQTVRLKEGEPSIVAGLLDNEETKSLNGIPGLANLPGVGYAFGLRTNSLTDTELSDCGDAAANERTHEGIGTKVRRTRDSNGFGRSAAGSFRAMMGSCAP